METILLAPHVAKLLPHLFTICCEIAENISKSYQNGGAVFVFDHSAKQVLHLTAPHNLLCTTFTERNFAQKPRNVQIKLFSSVELRIEEYRTKLVNELLAHYEVA